MRTTILMLNLFVLALVGQSEASDVSMSEQVQRLDRDWERYRGKFTHDYEAASTDDDRIKIQSQFEESLHALGKQALNVVSDRPKEPAAIDALLWLTRRGLSPESSEAWKILIRDHLTSDRLVPACMATRREVVANTVLAERFLREVIAHTSHREVRGHATFALANFLNFQAETLEQYESSPRDSWIPKMTPENRAALWLGAPTIYSGRPRDCSKTVAARFAELRDHRNRPLGELARGELYEMHHLGIDKASTGIERKLAPDIKGEDADGRSFRLSDYRGKVVVLTFSGNWCGPCRATYPEERELVTAQGKAVRPLERKHRQD